MLQNLPPSFDEQGQLWMHMIRALIQEALTEIGVRGSTISAGHISGTPSDLFSHTLLTHASGILGQLLYMGPAPTFLAGNTSATRKLLRQLGNGTISAPPVWDTLLASDIPDISATYILLSMAKTILSAPFDISSLGVKTVTTAHGLASAPAIEDVHLTVIEDSNVDDWAYNLLKVESVDATNVVAKINISTASVTGSQTAKFGIMVLKV